MERDTRYIWPHKDLLDVSLLSRKDVRHILDTAAMNYNAEVDDERA